jgi:hypothetical protein
LPSKALVKNPENKRRRKEEDYVSQDSQNSEQAEDWVNKLKDQ